MINVIIALITFHLKLKGTLKRLFTLLKENEIPLFEVENDDLNVNNNDDSESIESILEKTEYDIENQYSIIYQQWLNYN